MSLLDDVQLCGIFKIINMNKFYCLLLFFLGSINPVFAQEVYQAHTHVRLVSEQDAVVPGETFWVGLDVIPDDGWHVYWKNPGDSGLPPRIKWQLPSGIKAGDIRWPYPQRINVGSLTSFVYEHEVFLLVPVTVDGDFQPSEDVNLHALVTWLACKDECVPGRAELNLSVPLVKDISGVTFNGFKNSFDQTRRNLPRQVPILIACLFALIGGLVLNLMPCVLPVLSIKVLHLVERHPDKKIALSHSLIYALGILVSVWALALLLFILKSAGRFAGWGFQFQSPVFVIIVALILFVLALNLFGVFEFSIPDWRIAGASSRVSGQFYKRGHHDDCGQPLHSAFYGNGFDRGLKPAEYSRIWDIHLFRPGAGLALCAIERFSFSFIFCPKARALDGPFKKSTWAYFIGMCYLVIMGVWNTNRIRGFIKIL